MAATIIKSGTSDNQAIVDDTGHLLVTSTGGGGNDSVGPTGQPAPTSGTEIAGIDPSGNLKGVSVDANGFLNVNGTSTITGPVTTKQDGLNSFQTSQYTIGTSAVQLTPTPLSNRSSISLRVSADSGVAVYVGNSSGLTVSNGYPLYDRDTLQMDLTPSSTIYAISTAPDQVVAVLEIA